MAPVMADEPGGWPMRGADPQNTNVSPYFGVYRRPTFAWADVPPSQYPWFYKRHSHPAVAPDGTIYVGVTYGHAGSSAWKGELRSLAPDGTLKWTAPLKNSAGADLLSPRAPLIGPNGNIYLGWAAEFVGSTLLSVSFLAFDPEGSLLWRYEPNLPHELPFSDGPIMGPDGTIYVAVRATGENETGRLLALDSATGELIWWWSPTQAEPGIRNTLSPGPALGPNGRIYYVTVSSFDPGRLVCLDATTGKVFWQVTDFAFGTWDSPTVDDDGSVYIVEYPDDGWCTKFDENGNVLWDFDTGFGTIRDSAVLHAGKVYLSARAGPGIDRVFVVGAQTGQGLGTMVGLSSIGRVTIDAAGVRYFMASATIAAFSPNGELLWTHYDGGSPSTSSFPVTIGHHGMLLQAWGGPDYLAAYTSAVLEGDLDNNGVVGVVDLLALLAAWGPCSPCPPSADCTGDLNRDCTVGRLDLAILLANWRIDTCEVLGDPSLDCNDNFILDSCDIANGTSLDVNVNGIPDECECLADLSGNGVVDVPDLLLVLAVWGMDPGGPPDFDGDGTVAVPDLLTLLANWGPCP